jgi:penicillin-binding protein 2
VPLGRILRDVRRGQRSEPWAPVLVVRDAPTDLANYLDERHGSFPGVHVDVLPDRHYPQGALGSEFLGLLGEISPDQLAQRRYRGYRAGDVIGQTGVEATYDGVLRGRPAVEQIPVDALGEPVGRERLVRAAVPPHALRLTIDARIQRAAIRAIRAGIALARVNGHSDARAGAAVVMDARTGALYALASYPIFNQVSVARDRRAYLRLLASGAPALLDRATQGVYPLGSTFKPIVAEAALATGLITPTSVVPCTGSVQVGNMTFHNVEPSIYALLTLPQALSISCDTWFYRLGLEFYARQVASGSLAMQSWASRLGFGTRTGVDLPGEVDGIVPTPAWLRRRFTDPWSRVWYAGTSVNMSIGQGYLSVTPLQLAVAYAALANGGTVVRPHVADAVLTERGRLLRTLTFPPRRHVRLTEVNAIRQGLYDAAHHGTSAAVFGDFPVPVAGKTGTAEAPFGGDHSWYASWAPAWRPRYVVVVLIEHGGFGAQAAAPAAREIYEALFRRGLPAPAA